ncbi:transcription antiterminator [uncultured Anaerococcus sp.]|uniref:BglG family transcription antiterminator n=1 Tax=uncultured Anaerococcus sp. TaxID=293428 RepID=UPI0028891984|nr:transcription antiterminator [uncultured Anaerococcus sp.]
MKENRIKKIFEILTDDFKDCTANDISKIVNFSSKTVREDIKELNLLLKDNGAIIKSKPGVGYKFIINDKDKFSKFIKEDWPKYALEDDLNSQEYRVNKIILALIIENNYVKSEEFIDLLFISRSQLNLDLKVVREILAENNIEIISKPHYGMKVQAFEIDIRSFLVKYIEEGSKLDGNILEEVSEISTPKINKVSTFVLKQFKDKGFDTNLVKYNNFINYLIVSVSRISKEFLISTENKDDPIYEKYSSIYKLSLNISEEIEKIFNISLDEKEIEYIYINLLSKIDSYIPSEYNENIEQIIERTLMAIRNTLSIDLSNDSDLKSSLMIHLTPMIKRVKYGINLKNPLLDDIKRDHIAMECAKLCSSYIAEIYKMNINLDELGYIALHFSAALAKSIDNLNKKNILLICASGRATAKILKYRFMHEFSKYINNLDISDYLMAISMDLNSYDLIVSTIPITLNTKVPVIEVSAYLYKKDVERIL